MLAHEFIRSHIGRDSDFTTHEHERKPTPDGREHALIAQFASSAPEEFARAAELISPWVDGVDLNCGCPQSWAIKEGIGCSLMHQPELVASMVQTAKAALGPNKTVSVKIRIAKDLEVTKKWISLVQAAGVDYITVHGRTQTQRSTTPPDFDAIRILKDYSSVPVVANGDTYSQEDVLRIVEYTKVDGVMAARGILENPCLFTGPVDASVAIAQFLRYAIRHPIPYQLVQHHILDMMTGAKASRKDKKRLMECEDLLDLVDFVGSRYSIPG